MSTKTNDLKARLLLEIKTMLFVSVYLALLLGCFTTYRRLLLAEYHLTYFRYGYSVVEAVVLAKVIVFGRMLRLGERFNNQPLIVPTIYKTLVFSLFLFVFSVGEHLILGLWHHKGWMHALDDMLRLGIWEILAQAMVLFVALIPLFAVWETGRVLGEGKLPELFFKPRNVSQADFPYQLNPADE